jgi:hypothetical protein
MTHAHAVEECDMTHAHAVEECDMTHAHAVEGCDISLTLLLSRLEQLLQIVFAAIMRIQAGEVLGPVPCGIISTRLFCWFDVCDVRCLTCNVACHVTCHVVLGDQES